MTVSTSNNSVVYRGNGAATQFAVPFKVLDEDHLVVTRRVFTTGVLDYSYVGTDYSYTGIGDSSGTLTLAGTALDDDYELVIERIVPYTQDLDIVNAGGFYPETVEEQLDLMTMGVQQLADLAGRGAVVPVGEDGTELPKASDRAGKFFAFDGAGAFFLSEGTGADSALRTDLASSGGSALINWLQSGAALARTVQDKLRRDLPFTPFDFGAVGDKTTDDTTALAAMATVLNALCDNITNSTLIGNYPQLVFPRCAGFRTTATLILNSSIDVNMTYAPLWVTSTAGTPIIGLHYKDYKNTASQSPRDRTCVFDVRRVTLSNWSSESDIGVKIDSVYSSRVRLKRTDGFTVGFDVCLGYGELRLGDHRQNKKSYIRPRSSPAQFTNHLSVIGGSFATDSANNGTVRYGIVIEGNADGVNTILLDGQSYEIQKAQAGGGDAIPLVLDGTAGPVGSIRAINQRMEGVGNPIARVIGNVLNVEIGVLDGELEYTYPTSLMIDDQSTGGGSICAYRHHGATAPQWKEFFNTGRLVERTVKLTGPIVTIQNLENAADAGAAPATQTFIYGGTGPAFDANGFMTAAGPFTGVRIRLNGERSIGIVGVKPTGEAVDVRVICFDSAGAQIRTAGAVKAEQSIATYTAGAYGGYYVLGLNPANTAPAFEAVLAFASTVATVFIAISTPVSRFSLRSLGGRAQWFSATSHLKDQFVGDAVPIAFTNVAYKQGSKVLDITPTAAGTEGWILTDQPASGAAGTWKTFGVIAA